jgi:hypothetical protein
VPHHYPGQHSARRRRFVALDWKDGRLAAIEILDASTRLHYDLIDEAENNS